MYPLFRAPTQLRRSHLLRSQQFMLAVLAALLITAVACGTDRAGDNNGVAASSFQIEGDTLTWGPPWKENDARSVTITSSVKPNAATQAFLDRIEANGGTKPEFPTENTSMVGTVTIISKNSDGSTGQFDVSIPDLMNQLESQGFEQPGFGESDFEQFKSLLPLIAQLDLGVEFDIDSNGAITGVTNLAELAKTVNEFADSLITLAAFADKEFLPAEDVQQLKTLLEELPKTAAAQLAADSTMNVVTANLFLMRTGDYTVGQPVIVNGKTPTFIGLATDGTFSYELKDISAGTATVDVLVTPGQVDLFELMRPLVSELATAVGEDGAAAAEEMANLDPDQRSFFTAISKLILEPYTVTLTLDAETGWVTAADWSMELSIPEEFAGMIDEDEGDLDGFDPADFAVTVNVSAKFEKAVASNK